MIRAGAWGRRPLSVGTLLHVLLGFGLFVAVCQSNENVDGGSPTPRALSLFDRFPLHRKITAAILAGDIDEAANLIATAVKSGDGTSIVKGLSRAKASPGNHFSIVQTILRALRMGVDGEELEKTVKKGGQNGPGAKEVVDEVSGVVKATPTSTQPHSNKAPHTTPSWHPAPSYGPPPMEYVFQSGTPAAPTQHVYVPGVPYVVPAPPAPTPGTHYTVMVDPTPSSSYYEPGTMRTCRGDKEEQCCHSHQPHSPGCSCDVLSNTCRFKFISENPVIIQDTRRPGRDLWVCKCNIP